MGAGAGKFGKRPEAEVYRTKVLDQQWQLPTFPAKIAGEQSTTFGYEGRENFSEPRQDVRYHRLGPLRGVDPDMPSYRRGRGVQSILLSWHPQVTLNAYYLSASRFVLASGAFAAAISSIALVFKFRATASLLVVLIWTATIAGTQVARSFVKPGPDYFERHIGPEAFLVPWQYADASPGVPPHEKPNEVGFTFDLCLSNLKGRTDIDCRFIQQVHIFPNDKSTADATLGSWRKYRSQMKPGPDRSGYQSFDLSYTAQTGGPTRVQHYFARLNSNGEPTRLVVCRLENGIFCTHRALVGNYWFGYEADLAKGDETLDAKLAVLVESWRRK
jgi:hypothetical protein